MTFGSKRELSYSFVSLLVTFALLVEDVFVTVISQMSSLFSTSNSTSVTVFGQRALYAVVRVPCTTNSASRVISSPLPEVRVRLYLYFPFASLLTLLKA